MAIVTTDNQHYSDIADAIRAKGVNGVFKPSEMAQAIADIPTGGGGMDAEQAIFGVAPLPSDGHIGDRSWDNGYLGTAAFKYTSGGTEYTVWFLPVQGGHIYNFSNTDETWKTSWSRIHFYKKKAEPVAIPYVEKGFKIPSISWTPVVYISYADAGTGHSLQIQAPEDADFICISYTRKYADDYLTATFEEAT